MNQSELGALKVLDRKAWKKKIVKAMTDAGGRIPDAAEVLGIQQRQLYRWLDEPDMDGVPRVKRGETRSGLRGKGHHFITYKSKTQSIREWSDETGLPMYLLRQRLRAGWDPKDILMKRDARMSEVS